MGGRHQIHADGRRPRTWFPVRRQQARAGPGPRPRRSRTSVGCSGWNGIVATCTADTVIRPMPSAPVSRAPMDGGRRSWLLRAAGRCRSWRTGTGRARATTRTGWHRSSSAAGPGSPVRIRHQLQADRDGRQPDNHLEADGDSGIPRPLDPPRPDDRIHLAYLVPAMPSRPSTASEGVGNTLGQAVPSAPQSTAIRTPRPVVRGDGEKTWRSALGLMASGTGPTSLASLEWVQEALASRRPASPTWRCRRDGPDSPYERRGPGP